MKLNLWKISTFVLLGALALVASRDSVPVASAESQPNMAAALASLGAARSKLERAEHDKGGWRAAAIKATDTAIVETKRGIDYANDR